MSLVSGRGEDSARHTYSRPILCILAVLSGLICGSVKEITTAKLEEMARRHQKKSLVAQLKNCGLLRSSNPLDVGELKVGRILQPAYL